MDSINGRKTGYSSVSTTEPHVEMELQLRLRRRSIERRTVALVCAMIIGLQSGTTNAFNTIAGHIQDDTGLSDSLMTLLSSLGIIGLFFTIPAGFINDRFGAMWTSLIGAVLTSVGYAGMSFTDEDTYPAMLICLMIVGFGSGATFLAALSTGLKSIPGYPVYKQVLDCASDDCWPYYLRSLAVSTAIFLFLPSIGLRLLPPDDPPPATAYGEEEEDFGISDESIPMPSLSKELVLHQELQAAQHKTPISLLYSLHTLRNIFFWFLIFAYFAGIASAVFIITSNKSIWTTFTNDKDEDWAVQITTAFSVTNTLANIISGFLSDYLWSRFHFPRNKLLALVLAFDTLVYITLIALSYSVSNPSTTAEIFFLICMVSVGFCFGTYLSVVPIIVGDFYGHVNFGIYFGYMQLGSTGATFIIPNIAEVVKQSMGNYNIIFVIIAICLGVSCVGVFFKRPTPIGRW